MEWGCWRMRCGRESRPSPADADVHWISDGIEALTQCFHDAMPDAGGERLRLPPALVPGRSAPFQTGGTMGGEGKPKPATTSATTNATRCRLIAIRGGHQHANSAGGALYLRYPPAPS